MAGEVSGYLRKPAKPAAHARHSSVVDGLGISSGHAADLTVLIGNMGAAC